MHPELQKFAETKIVPVVAIHDAADAEPLAQALIEGGLPCAEITFRTSAAAAAIEAMAKLGTIQVGAGTVSKIDQVKAAVDAGSSFIVSPGFNPKVVEYCCANDILITPGISNPSDIEMAIDFPLEVLKFFPAEAFGGLTTLKAMSAPYGGFKFIPTGGIGPGNLLDYLRFDKVLACGGSWMVKSDLISEQKFDDIRALTADAIALTKSL